ncbi:MAG: hypothetical protein NVS4B8_28150 [Herpetosiphon sp.]
MTNAQPLLDQINGLSAEQSQEAVQLFLQQLPASLSASGEQPLQADLELQASLLLQDAPPELKPRLETLANDSNHALNGAVAKAILVECAQHSQLEPYVKQAVHLSAQPHMFDPISIGLLLIALAALPTSFEKTKDGAIRIQWDNLTSAAKIMDNLKALFDKLPSQ